VSVYRSTWVALVQALSADVVARLAAAYLPPLTPEIDGTPGAIQIGPQFVAEQGSPPRVLMIPRGFEFENNKDPGNYLVNGAISGGNTQTPRAIAVQWKRFEVQCWGCNFSNQTTPSPDPALDYDAAQALAEIVWQAAQGTSAGVWRTQSGIVDPGAPTLVRVGRVLSFDLALSTPVADTTLPYAPTGTGPALQPPHGVYIQVNGQTPANPNQ
jgi:hypothetical protein